ncbi:MAG: lipid A biosynthesis acyltransferase, partial [Acidobacteriota bacterium]|nr:lipid A biosynthesis acyltransferase [Acidobacteriota bacterium]
MLGIFGTLPRRVSLCLARGVAALACRSLGHLRRTATRNLNLAFPHWTSEHTRVVVRGVFQNFGRLLVEFARLPRLNRDNISKVVVYDGFDNYAESLRRGSGTLFLTAHYGAWELCPFAHALYGHPLKFVVRPID